MQEEVVSVIILPEVYRVDEKIHTDLKLETPIIKAEEKCIVQDELKLVQDMTLICDTPTPLQINVQAQPTTEQKVLPERALQSKIFPVMHAGRRETSGSESFRKEIPTYTDSICRPPSKPPDNQNNVEGEIGKKISPYINPMYIPPPKPPNT